MFIYDFSSPHSIDIYKNETVSSDDYSESEILVNSAEQIYYNQISKRRRTTSENNLTLSSNEYEFDENDHQESIHIEEKIIPPTSHTTINTPSPKPKSLYDSTDLFFQSISQTVKQLPKRKKAQIKLKIMQLVTEAEIESLDYENADVFENE